MCRTGPHPIPALRGYGDDQLEAAIRGYPRQRGIGTLRMVRSSPLLLRQSAGRALREPARPYAQRLIEPTAVVLPGDSRSELRDLGG
jgi:hypothetical protein